MSIYRRGIGALALLIGCLFISAPSKAGGSAPRCERTIEADLVALDQPIFLNRLGASLPGGMIYALRRDVAANDRASPADSDAGLVAGQVHLKADHRPRPLVLRARVGDCLHITFENLLAPIPVGSDKPVEPPPMGNGPKQIPCPNLSPNQHRLYPEQTCTRSAGVHIYGMDEMAVNGVLEDGSVVGANLTSLAQPGHKTEYLVHAGAEGVFLMYSTGSDASTGLSGGGFGGQLSAGLFGSLVVEPRQAEWYRSQITREDMLAATMNATALPPGYTLMCAQEDRCSLAGPGLARPVPVRRDGDGALYALDGHPILNYAAVRFDAAEGRCVPVLRMVDVGYDLRNGKCLPQAGHELLTYFGDLTAAITGPNAGRFSENDQAPPFNPNAVEPGRHEPYREFVEHYHDVLTVDNTDQAFSGVYGSNPVLSGGGEAFAINYGSDGIGSEILANRAGVGPEGGCVDCRFEEFFLSAWAIGDPAELVSHPAGLTDPSPSIRPVPYTPKTTLRDDDSVKYPSDPSNVYHSYIGDRVVFRIVHAGQLVTHLHHLHAHQWLHSRNNDESTYLDSQLISPGSTYTEEIDHDGSGNRNRTVGDAIFHCHFYPHFAGGMWGMWRSHDVFEAGTDVTKDPGREFVRALPDGELRRGTPIPAVVPLPTMAMAPLPARIKICPVDRSWTGDQMLDANGACPAVKADELSGEAAFIAREDFDHGINPGYPFYIAGVAGQRAPHPPLAYPADPDAVAQGQTAFLDGGLARHVALAGRVSNDHANAWDFSKDLDRLTAVQLPEEGTKLERLAMGVHRVCKHPSVRPDGQSGDFLLNGGPNVPGAPYANPSWGSKGDIACADLAEPALSDPLKANRIYKAADIQTDVVFNKLGWHYPQERFEALWEDVKPTVAHQRAPEPLFFRANSGETIEFWQTNLVPAYYELDDYEVRTPTDVIGQHIHLVKFDVTASDGAANGFNYEAGSLSGDAVREAIKAIRAENHCGPTAAISFACPQPKAPPAELGNAPAGQNWLGAQTTVERWWADPVMDNKGVDRTLRTVFTHDHFGPSTHQQIGLYAGLLVEPKGSSWSIPAVLDQVTGTVRTNVAMGERADGGPTSWAADIKTREVGDSYREFALEFQSIAEEYLAGSRNKPIAYPCIADPASTIPYDCVNGGVQPTPLTPVWGWADQSNAIAAISPFLRDPTVPGLQPALVSAGIGGGSVNYRNEPLPARTQPPVGMTAHDPLSSAQDLALAWASIPRNDPNLNLQPRGTVTLQAPEAQVPVAFPGKFVGAEPNDPYTPLMRAYPGDRVQVRVLVGAHEDPHTFTINGVKWLMEPSATDSGHVSAQPMGISEHFEMLFSMPPAGAERRQDYLYQPDANTTGQQDGLWGILRAYKDKQDDLPVLPNNRLDKPLPEAAACPSGAPAVRFDVTATTAAKALPGKRTLTYNSRTSPGAITQPDAILYLPTDDLDSEGYLKPGRPLEPLILRASAGDCIGVTLTNRLDPRTTDIQGNLIFNQPKPDQMALTDNVVTNTKTQYNLYPSARAGLHAQLVDEVVTQSDGVTVGVNPEQTAAPCLDGPCPTVHYTWYAGLRTLDGQGVKYQPMELGTINLLPADPIEQPIYGAVGALVIEPAGATWRIDPGTRASATVFPKGDAAFREFVAVWQSSIERTGYEFGGKTLPVSNAINYRSEPVAYRLPATPDLTFFQSNLALAPAGTPSWQAVNIAWDPQTPVFTAAGGTPVRFRFTNPAGQQLVTEIHGHHWQEEPWAPGSAKMAANPFSENMGAIILGSVHSLNVLVDSAGGTFATPGDYLYRNAIVDTPSQAGPGTFGSWGLFRVEAAARDAVILKTGDDGVIRGYVTPTKAAGGYAPTVRLTGGPFKMTAAVDPANGAFAFPPIANPGGAITVQVVSAFGGAQDTIIPGTGAPFAAFAVAAPVEVPALDALVQAKIGRVLNPAARRKAETE